MLIWHAGLDSFTSGTIWHYRIWSSLVRLIAYFLFGAKPSPDPIMGNAGCKMFRPQCVNHVFYFPVSCTAKFSIAVLYLLIEWGILYALILLCTFTDISQFLPWNSNKEKRKNTTHACPMNDNDFTGSWLRACRCVGIGGCQTISRCNDDHTHLKKTSNIVHFSKILYEWNICFHMYWAKGKKTVLAGALTL